MQAVMEGRAHSDTAGLLEDYIAEQCAAVRAGEADLRLGRDAVHPTRVATRRLRSLVRVFAEVFDRAAAEALDEELAWYAGLLGAVRERQVLRARFAAVEPDSGAPDSRALDAALAAVDEQLLAEEGHHRGRLLQALVGTRYQALVDTLAAWRSAPPFEPSTAAGTDLARHVRAAGSAADKRLSRATAGQDDAEALHRARKAAKRARYAAEVAGATLGERAARRSIDHYKAIQEALGEHQDSVDAVSFLDRLQRESDGTGEPLGSAYAYLDATQREAARQALTQAVALSQQPAPPGGRSSRQARGAALPAAESAVT